MMSPPGELPVVAASKVASCVIDPLPCAISKIVPSLFASPPVSVTPKRSPDESITGPVATNEEPLGAAGNETSSVGVLLPAASSSAAPVPLAPPTVVKPYRFPALVDRQLLRRPAEPVAAEAAERCERLERVADAQQPPGFQRLGNQVASDNFMSAGD